MPKRKKTTSKKYAKKWKPKKKYKKTSSVKKKKPSYKKGGYSSIKKYHTTKSGWVAKASKPSSKMASFGTVRGGCRVRHSEYLGDVFTSGTAGNFQNDGIWIINPGNPDTFPWLSRLAMQFQEYHFRGLMFQFKTTSVDALNSTNTALGVVIGATNYNIAQPAFASKQEMDNYEFVVSGKPSRSWNYPVNCKPQFNVLNKLYVSNSRSLNQTGKSSFEGTEA